MASVGDVIVALEKFELDLIEKQWAEDIWTSEFTSCPDDLPDEFADKFSPLSYCDIVQVIEQADKVINTWLNDCVDSSIHSDSESSSSTIGPSWTSLQEVDYKTLLALLYFYICKGQIHNQDITSVHVCVKSTSFYFTLLMIPGSNIYKVFHLTLFEKSLETFFLHKYLEIATGTMVKKTKQKKNGDNESDEEFLEMDETLTLSQQQNVVKQLNFLLSTFQILVTKFSFKKYPEALNLSLNMLVELTRIERKSTVQEFASNNNNNSLAPLSRNAYMTIKEFCSDNHGRVPEIIRLVFYYLMPNLTLVGGPAVPEMAKYSNKELNNIRQIAVSFLTENIITMGETVHAPIRILIQHLCFNMIDRADYRTKATEMVLAILSKLPMDVYYSIIKWIFQLALNEGAHHRVIGLELLSKLIYLKPGSNELSQMNETYGQFGNSQLGASTVIQNRTDTLQRTDLTTNISQAPVMSFSQPINYVPIEYRRAMLAIIVDRLRDEAAIVKTRALSILSELIANKTSPTLRLIFNDIFIKPYLDLDYITDTGEGEREFLKGKAFIAALDKVRDPEVNKSMIPGARVIVKKIFEKCLDERVNVRKSALHLISSIFKLSSKWMTDKNLETFGMHCRDPALSIRKDMVGGVTELMLFFPDHEPLTKLWVDEVVPQINDREIRVQEQVLQVFTNTILNNITSFDRMNTPKDVLPWKLLDRISERKMKSFLVAACGLWQKSGHLPQTLIKTIRTHVGTENDKPAWVLLSSISEYVNIEKPEFVMNHYLEAIAEGKEDAGTSHLVLVTLNNSWQKLNRRDQEILQNDMYARLKTFSVNSTMTGLTVDIATGITVVTADDELAGKQEVAKWAVDMIQACETHLEICLRSTDSNTGDCEVCVNILSLLGSLASVCPEKIKHTTFLMLHSFVMKPRTKFSSYDSNKRAMVVLTLAKMALRCDLFARNLVAGLAQLLNTSHDPVLLNNVIVAISDIGERYANLIEPLMSSICVCLKSKHSSVKEITLILLVELLQEDYLKARGALVFHLLTLINDPDPKAVNIVKYYFTNCLIARHPFKMYQLLLPSLFHFNNYHSHPDYPRLEMTDQEWKAFDVSGPVNHQKRMNVYRFMLSNVPDMVRMKCLHFICTVVLNGAADNIISIKTKNGEQLLFDALSVLLTKEIKIEYNELVKKKNEDGEEEDNQKENPLYKLGKQMFTAAQKKEIIETIVPICCKLKKKLVVEDKKLLPYLHKFVRELVKEYKDEVNEIFKEDKQFGIEILHEIDKIANEEADDDEEEDEELVGKLTTENNNENNAQDFDALVNEAPQTNPSVEEQAPLTDVQMTEVIQEVEVTTEKETESQTEGIVENRESEKVQEAEKEDAEVKRAPQGEESTEANVAKSQVKPQESNTARVLRRPLKQPLDTSLIEDYNEQRHKPPPRRGGGYCRSSTDSDTHNRSSNTPKHMDVQVLIEKLNISSSSRSSISSNSSMRIASDLNPQVRLRRMSVPEKTPEKEKIALKRLSISLERLPSDVTSLERKTSGSPHHKSGGSKKCSKEFAELKELSVSLEKLDPNYLPGNVKMSKRKMTSDEDNIEKEKRKIIMPPPLLIDPKKDKRRGKVSLTTGPKTPGGKSPKTPDAHGSKSLLTSTPMVVPSDINFDSGLSPILDDGRDSSES